MERLLVKNTNQLTEAVKVVVSKLVSKSANILLLKAPMGAGKTTFTYELSKYLNSLNNAASPTFVILKIYHLSKNATSFEKIYHIDLYRLTNSEEIDDLNLFEDAREPNNLYVIEWPERVESRFNNFVKVTINIVSDTEREFIVE